MVHSSHACIQNLSASHGSVRVLHDISFELNVGDCLAILGPMGAGKTTLAKALAGRLFRTGQVHFSSNRENKRSFVLLVEQQHRFTNRSNTQDFYYQQRFNSADSQDSYTLTELLAHEDSSKVEYWLRFFHLDTCIDKPLLQLSNGENKRLQLVKSVLRQPDWLILDNPFLGLDITGRQILSDCLDALSALGISFILVNSPSELPRCVNRVILLDQGEIVWDGPRQNYEAQQSQVELSSYSKEVLLNLMQDSEPFVDFKMAVGMRNVSISYGDKLILSKVHWQVNRGERWALSGSNGAGKSTLLSLITADNPQAYAQDLVLFDKKRGSGESIWDIKKQIGFVSPELHAYFRESGTVFTVVASGLFDTMGLFKKVTDLQAIRIERWLDVLGILYLRECLFQQISAGEQRMVLLARALVKNPALLVLDEPCQGLDTKQIHLVKLVLDFIANHSEMTLIYVSHFEQDIPSCVDQRLTL